MTSYKLTTDLVNFPGHAGDEIEAYFAGPAEAGEFPGVVVIHHLPGWDAWTREVVRKFADAGYNAVAPHLFSRWRPGTEQQLRAQAFQTFGPPDGQVMGDLAASARYLKALPNSNGKAGCIGFCSGGRQAYLAASQVKELDAAVDCWGGAVIPDARFPVNVERPVSPFGATNEIHMPLMGIFGNDDDFPPPAEVDRIEAELKAHGKEYEFHRYDGASHGFWCTAPWPAMIATYHAQHAADSFRKVLTFYEKHLT